MLLLIFILYRNVRSVKKRKKKMRHFIVYDRYRQLKRTQKEND